MESERSSRPPRSRRCQVPAEAVHLQTLGRPDYQDAFGVDIDRTNRRSALGWARGIFEDQSPLIGSLLMLVGWLMRFPPGPLSSPDHVLGLTILEQTQDAVVIGRDTSAVSLRIVILAPAGNEPLTFSTFLRFHRMPWRYGGRVVLIAHRRVVPLLLDRVAARSATEHAHGVTA
jgi:hypothetical protein